MRTLVYFLFICISINGWSQDKTDCNCCKEKYRQFDFWIGDWVVKDSAGTLLGHNKIEPIENGCGLKESWTGAKGTTGTSISFYNRNKDEWHQTWVDANGGVILMDGQLSENAMILLSDKKVIEGNEGFIQNRTTWIPLEDGRVRHIWEQTRDGGKTWQVVFEGFYTKRTKN